MKILFCNEHKWDNELFPAHQIVFEGCCRSPSLKPIERLYCLRKGCGGYRDYKKKSGNIKLSDFFYETSKYCNGKN